VAIQAVRREGVLKVKSDRAKGLWEDAMVMEMSRGQTGNQRAWLGRRERKTKLPFKRGWN
jgi:hypothetical protein